MQKLKAGAEKLGINLDSGQLQAFERYYRELIEWNRKINLTAITGYEDIQVKHFLDSLTAAAAFNFDRDLRVIDVGTGAGLPGIPLKIVFPRIKLTLLEATAKKTKFLEHLINVTGLTGIDIIAGRAEEIAHNPEYRERYDVVLSRAVASLPVLVELALPFAKTRGLFIAYKKGDTAEEIKQSARALKTMGGVNKEIIPVNPALFDDKRYLIKIEKLDETPPAYPRRPGIPEKRPLLP